MIIACEHASWGIRRPAMGWAVLLALALAGSSACRRPSEPGADRPPIVVITIDTLRADHLGCYGYFRDTSPTIDALAAESILFERCIVPMATTLPTHASIFTGTYPLEHGILANYKHGGFQFVPSPRLASLAQYAGRLGYQTAAFVSATPVKRGTGIEAGFDIFDEPSATERRAEQTTRAVIDWLDKRDHRPLLLWVHYFDPHNEYAPPPPYDTRYVTDEPLESMLARARFADHSRRPTGATVVTRSAINGYDGEIRYTDDQLAVLFRALKSRGLWEDAAVVLIGDHGEGLGQHGEPGHGLVWDEQLHAPLIVRVPGIGPRRIADPVSAVDLLPTLLGLLELPVSEAFRAQFSGVDALAPGAETRHILSRSSDRRMRFDVPTTYSITGNGWKYIHAIGGESMLFDLISDPHELENVAAAHPDVANDLCGRLRADVIRQRARGVQLGSGAVVPLPRDRRGELADLGYAEISSFQGPDPVEQAIECPSDGGPS